MRLCVINAHPDPSPERLCYAIADAYALGAEQANHTVERVNLGELDIPFLESSEDFSTPPDKNLRVVQDQVADCEHLMIVYPLWLGTLPAKLKAFLEQISRMGFFLDTGGDSQSWPIKKMKGRSVRLIVTMGMPGFAYRLMFGAHSLKGLEAGIFRMAGFKPVRHSIFGAVGTSPQRCTRMLSKAARLGQAAR